MFKYVLKMLAGQNPMQVLSDMPERDFNKVAGFVSNLDKSGIPRKQRRIMDSLADVECPDDIRDRVYSNLVKCDMDTGFTYSNKRLKCTVMVIGLHSSQAQFLNSFEHEMRHMVDDIAETFGLNMGGEEVAYLTGDMNSTLWKDIHKFICCDCKCKNH